MDIQKLLKSLRVHKVKFLIIGGWALPAYGYERMTVDIDIFIEPKKENAERTVTALKAVGYNVVTGVDVTTFLNKKVLLREYILRTDIHPFVTGCKFEDIWKRRIKTEIKGIKVFGRILKNKKTRRKINGNDKRKNNTG